MSGMEANCRFRVDLPFKMARKRSCSSLIRGTRLWRLCLSASRSRSGPCPSNPKNTSTTWTNGSIPWRTGSTIWCSTPDSLNMQKNKSATRRRPKFKSQFSRQRGWVFRIGSIKSRFRWCTDKSSKTSVKISPKHLLWTSRRWAVSVRRIQRWRILENCHLRGFSSSRWRECRWCRRLRRSWGNRRILLKRMVVRWRWRLDWILIRSRTPPAKPTHPWNRPQMASTKTYRTFLKFHQWNSINPSSKATQYPKKLPKKSYQLPSRSAIRNLSLLKVRNYSLCRSSSPTSL